MYSQLVDEPEILPASDARLQMHARYLLASEDLKMANQLASHNRTLNPDEAALVFEASQKIPELRSNARALHKKVTNLFMQEVLGITPPN
tara:strand:- start:772 stop:1041 length:270 start_codon:yes stop_codon:yes gene_type:complete